MSWVRTEDRETGFMRAARLSDIAMNASVLLVIFVMGTTLLMGVRSHKTKPRARSHEIHTRPAFLRRVVESGDEFKAVI